MAGSGTTAKSNKRSYKQGLESNHSGISMGTAIFVGILRRGFMSRHNKQVFIAIQNGISTRNHIHHSNELVNLFQWKKNPILTLNILIYA